MTFVTSVISFVPALIATAVLGASRTDAAPTTAAIQNQPAYQAPRMPWCRSTPEAYEARLEFMRRTPRGPDGRQQSPEDQLLAAISQQPRGVTNYLDLARCSYILARGSRLSHVEQLLAKALAIVREERDRRPVPAAAAAPTAPNLPMRIDGSVALVKIRDVPPLYPLEARRAGLSGVVFIDAFVDKGGNVREARVVGSFPPFDGEAAKAVRQWKYQPLVVDGRAVEIVKLVLVKFGPTPTVTPTDGIDIARFHAVQGQYMEASVALEQALNIVREELRSMPVWGFGATPGVGQPVAIGQFGAGAYRPRMGATDPVVIRQTHPDYTSEAMTEKIQGEVFLEAIVSPDGTVGDVRITKSLDPKFGLDQKAIEAAKQWRFLPGTNADGKPVSVLMVIQMDFRIH
jgi:TonB family protein